MVSLTALWLPIVLSAVAVEQATLRDRIRREQESRARLSRYSSPAVVDRIVQATGMAELAMVADEGEVSVLFADLTGFTSMAERMDPAEVVQVLNQVFERFTEAVFALDGTLDKFRGDGMMAFFSAPLQLPDHAERAVESALRMQEMLDPRSARVAHEPDRVRLIDGDVHGRCDWLGEHRSGHSSRRWVTRPKCWAHTADSIARNSKGSSSSPNRRGADLRSRSRARRDSSGSGKYYRCAGSVDRLGPVCSVRLFNYRLERKLAETWMSARSLRRRRQSHAQYLVPGRRHH